MQGGLEMVQADFAVVIFTVVGLFACIALPSRQGW